MSIARQSALTAQITSRANRAIKEYNLIEEGDRILAAVSGGKDSLTMLYVLREFQKHSGVKFEIHAAHIRTDFHCAQCVHRAELTKVFERLGINYTYNDVKVLDDKGKTNCFWCSWNRRKSLFQSAASLSCNKVAFGHHKDDIVETTLLNLFFQGEVSTMKPRQEMFGGKIIIIRPLCFAEEGMIKKVAGEQGFPQQLCRCPFGATSQRRMVKAMIKKLADDFPGVDIKENIFGSLYRLKRSGLCKITRNKSTVLLSNKSL